MATPRGTVATVLFVLFFTPAFSIAPPLPFHQRLVLNLLQSDLAGALASGVLVTAINAA